MKTPITIHPQDTPAEARARHLEIERTLEGHGKESVVYLLGTGGLPTNWNPIIHAWLKGDKLEPEDAPSGDDQKRQEA